MENPILLGTIIILIASGYILWRQSSFLNTIHNNIEHEQVKKFYKIESIITAVQAFNVLAWAVYLSVRGFEVPQ